MLILNNEEIGKRVLEVRTELHLTREVFGQKIGVAGSVIQNIEQNRNKKINEPLIISIATEYGINKNWILYGQEPKYISNTRLLEQLKEKYNLSNLEYAILENYLQLDKEQRKAVELFLNNIIESSKSQSKDNKDKKETMKYVHKVFEEDGKVKGKSS